MATHEALTARQRLAERLILGLRLADGVPAAWLDERIAPRARAPLALVSPRGASAASSRDARGRARLTEDGFLLSDALFVELL